MKKNIIKGKPELRKHECWCDVCDCQFQYMDDDIYENKNLIGRPSCVKCPWCLNEIRCPSSDEDLNEMLLEARSGSYESMVDEIG